MTSPTANETHAAPESGLELPTEQHLLRMLHELAQESEPLTRYLRAHATGVFVHPDGRTDELGIVRLSPATAALLSYLARQCQRPLSMETGFGMGSSATVILATRRWIGQPFTHYVIDPYGLADNRGSVVQAYLEAEFGEDFNRLWWPSQLALPRILVHHGFASSDLIFIDGGHHLEDVFTDFVLADMLCSVDGYIVFDDALFPAIETVINYVVANRRDYATTWFPVPNAAVLRKLKKDERRWDSFAPFVVPRRSDWTAATG